MARRQLHLALRQRPRWGGARPGAGRKLAPGHRPSVAHRARPALEACHPVLVTLRGRAGVSWLRTPPAFRALTTALSHASHETFRVVHFSVQTNHVHLIVEAAGADALSRGMRGLAIRCALAVNRALGRRGAIWGERYHARALTTPRMVRNGLVYVLANARKHLRAVAGSLDPCSSAPWFDGYRGAPAGADGGAPTRAPRTWLLRVGWRRHGLIGADEAPSGRSGRQ